MRKSATVNGVPVPGGGASASKVGPVAVDAGSGGVPGATDGVPVWSGVGVGESLLRRAVGSGVVPSATDGVADGVADGDASGAGRGSSVVQARSRGRRSVRRRVLIDSC